MKIKLFLALLILALPLALLITKRTYYQNGIRADNGGSNTIGCEVSKDYMVAGHTFSCFPSSLIPPNTTGPWCTPAKGLQCRHDNNQGGGYCNFNEQGGYGCGWQPENWASYNPFTGELNSANQNQTSQTNNQTSSNSEPSLSPTSKTATSSPVSNQLSKMPNPTNTPTLKPSTQTSVSPTTQVLPPTVSLAPSSKMTSSPKPKLNQNTQSTYNPVDDFTPWQRFVRWVRNIFS